MRVQEPQLRQYSGEYDLGADHQTFLIALAIFPTIFDKVGAAAVTDRTMEETRLALRESCRRGFVAVTERPDCSSLYILDSSFRVQAALMPDAPQILQSAHTRHTQHFLAEFALYARSAAEEVEGDSRGAEYLEYLRVNFELAAVTHIRERLGEPAVDQRPAVLSERQWQVAQLVAAGRTNLQIANALGIAEWTAINHVRSVMQRLECSSRVDVARIVLSLSR